MNQWLRIALYSFVGIIIGTLLLGILSPGMGANPIGYGNRYDYEYNQMHQNNGMGMGMRGGMGMHNRR